MGARSDSIPIALLQIDPGKRRRTEGVAQTLDAVRRTAKRRSGILALPEIWSGGFTYPEIKDLARETPKILDKLCTISGEYQTTIIGSLPETRQGKLYNTAAVVDSGKIVGRYRKQRLFSPMQEDRRFSTSRSQRTFATRHGRIAVVICFDLRFPELFSGMREQGAWLLVVPAQWPALRAGHWETLLIARAIEGQFYVAGCNRVGRTGGTRFFGGSMIIDPWGKVIARGGRGPDTVSSVLHPSRIREIRRRIPMRGTPGRR